eukprot:scaffold215573_cov32-Tisochrysis_lutea.AAC.2
MCETYGAARARLEPLITSLMGQCWHRLDFLTLSHHVARCALDVHKHGLETQLVVMHGPEKMKDGPMRDE